MTRWSLWLGLEDVLQQMPTVKGPISSVVKVNSPLQTAVVAVISVGSFVVTCTSESFPQLNVNNASIAMAKKAVIFRVVFIILTFNGLIITIKRVNYCRIKFCVTPETVMKYRPLGNFETSICWVSPVRVPVIRVWPMVLTIRYSAAAPTVTNKTPLVGLG